MKSLGKHCEKSGLCCRYEELEEVKTLSLMEHLVVKHLHRQDRIAIRNLVQIACPFVLLLEDKHVTFP